MSNLESLDNESIGDIDLVLDKDNPDPDEKAKVTKSPKRIKDLKAKMAEEFKHEAMPSAAVALSFLVKVFGDLTICKFFSCAQN